jgi:chemotaxis protein histidine kinase CheA
MIDLDDELALDYLVESREHLANIETDLLAIERGGAETDEELVNRVFRAVHSVKGGAGVFDLMKIQELAHQTEDVLALIRSHEMALTPDLARVLLGATDRLQELIENPGMSDQADISGVLAALATLYTEPRASTGKRGASAAGRGRPGGPLRVLLVEDDFASRLLLQTFLSRYGECHIAVKGREAVEAFRSAFQQGQR